VYGCVGRRFLWWLVTYTMAGELPWSSVEKLASVTR